MHRSLIDELGSLPAIPFRSFSARSSTMIRSSTSPAWPAAPQREGRQVPAKAQAAAEITSRPSESRKTVTVMVIEREALADGDAESRRRTDEQELDATKAVVERHGGSIESVLGSRTMAVFGVPLAHEDDALRALRASAELTRRSGALAGAASPPPVGVATGEILAGGPLPISAEEPVRVAAELVDATSPGETLVSEQVRPLLGGAGRIELVEGPPRGWRLVELASEPPPALAPARCPDRGARRRAGPASAMPAARRRGTHCASGHDHGPAPESGSRDLPRSLQLGRRARQPSSPAAASPMATGSPSGPFARSLDS